MSDSFAFSDLFRRAANLIRIGKISAIDGAKVKVRIGKVTTNWLPIISGAGDTSIWIPIAIDEQVAVFSPYGETAQSFVLRSIHYNDFPAPGDKNDVLLKTKSDVKAEGDGRLAAIFEKGFELMTGDLRLSISAGRITLDVGSASISLSSSGIRLDCGSSSINLSNSNISLNSTSISTSPPICKCTGGL